MSNVILHDYWRSSASYRVRVALNLLGIDYDARKVDLLTGAHKAPEHLALNPQGLVPVLEIDGLVLTQSLAIMEYLHATRQGSTLLPDDPLRAQRVRALSYTIAMEIHPVCNLSVATHAVALAGGGEEEKIAWMQHFIGKGLSAFEEMLAQGPASDFCSGSDVTMADCCLLPQLYNAERWGASFTVFPNISRVAERLQAHPAFKKAHPDRVQDQ